MASDESIGAAQLGEEDGHSARAKAAARKPEQALEDAELEREQLVAQAARIVDQSRQGGRKFGQTSITQREIWAKKGEKIQAKIAAIDAALPALRENARAAVAARDAEAAACKAARDETSALLHALVSEVAALRKDVSRLMTLAEHNEKRWTLSEEYEPVGFLGAQTDE